MKQPPTLQFHASPNSIDGGWTLSATVQITSADMEAAGVKPEDVQQYLRDLMAHAYATLEAKHDEELAKLQQAANIINQPKGPTNG